MYEPEERSGLGSRIPFVLGAIVAAAVVIAVAVFVFNVGRSGGGGGGGSNETIIPTVAPSPTPVGSTPEELALGAYVQTNLKATYTGDCAKAVAPLPSSQAPIAGQTPAAGASGVSGATGAPAAPPTNASTLCSTRKGDRQGSEAYVLGASAASPTEWAFLEQQNGAWQVVQITQITPANSVVPGIPWPLKQGAEVVVVGTGACLNVRTEPKVDPGNAVDCIADGTKIKLAAGPTDADGIQWWQVDGRAGWVAADYLRYEDAAQ